MKTITGQDWSQLWSRKSVIPGFFTMPMPPSQRAFSRPRRGTLKRYSHLWKYRQVLVHQPSGCDETGLCGRHCCRKLLPDTGRRCVSIWIIYRKGSFSLKERIPGEAFFEARKALLERHGATFVYIAHDREDNYRLQRALELPLTGSDPG